MHIRTGTRGRQGGEAGELDAADATCVCCHPRWQDLEAYRLFREAEIMEGDGDPMGALKLYQRAVRLSPALASVYGY